MGLEELISKESAVVATATAAVLSPRTRETLRRGAVLGVAGALKAGDVLAGAARGATRGVRGGDPPPAPTATKATARASSASTVKRRRPSSSSSRSRAAGSKTG